MGKTSQLTPVLRLVHARMAPGTNRGARWLRGLGDGEALAARGVD